MATFRCSFLRLVIVAGLLTQLAIGTAAYAQEIASERQVDPSHWEYIAHIGAANAYVNAGQVLAARSSLERCPEHLRGWEWAYLDRRVNPGLGVFPGSEDCTSIAFSSDGTMLYGCDGKGPLRVWDVASLTELPPIEGPQVKGRPTRALAVSPRGTFVLFAPTKRKAGTPVKIVLRGSDLEERMTSMADVQRLKPDLATVAVVRIETEEVVSFLGSTGGRVDYVEFSEDERRVMLAGNPPMLCYCWGSRVANVLTGETLYQGTYGASGGARPAMSPDGRLVAETHDVYQIEIVDVDSGDVVHTITTTDQEPSDELEGSMRSVSFLPGSALLLGTSDRGDLYAWDVEAGSLLTGERQRETIYRRRKPDAFSRFYRTPRSVVATCDDGSMRELNWDAATGTPRIREMTGFETYIQNVAVHAASNRMATCSSDEIRLWTQDRDIRTFTPLPDAKRGLDLSDHTLLCHGDDTCCLFDVATHQVTHIDMSPEEPTRQTRSTYLEDGTHIVAISPNGRYQVLNPDAHRGRHAGDRLSLVDRVTGETTLRWIESSDVYHPDAEFIDDDTLVFQPLPDDRFIAPISDEYATLAVFDPGRDVIRCQIPDAPPRRSAVAVDPGQNHLVLRADGSLHMWNLTTGEHVRSFGFHAGGLRRFYFLPDGSRVLTTGGDGTIHVWDPTTGDLVAVLEDLPAHAHGLDVIGDGRQIALNRKWIIDTRPVAEFVEAREAWAPATDVVAAPTTTSR